MAGSSYEPLASEWGELFPLTLNIRVDGPLRRRIEDLTSQIGRELPELPPVLWGVVLFAGFMQLRAFTRSEQSLFRGAQKLLADSLSRAAAEPA